MCFHNHDVIIEQGITPAKCHSSQSGFVYLKFCIMTELEHWNCAVSHILAHDLSLKCNRQGFNTEAAREVTKFESEFFLILAFIFWRKLLNKKALRCYHNSLKTMLLLSPFISKITSFCKLKSIDITLIFTSSNVFAQCFTVCGTQALFTSETSSGQPYPQALFSL